MRRFGEVVLVQMQIIDTFEVKTRPALVLFEENNNVIVAGITSNLERKGVSLSKKGGVIKESVIMLNYIFTLSEKMIQKQLFTVSSEKKKIIKQEFLKRLY